MPPVKTVLVVDDGRMIREAVCSYPESKGLRTAAAGTGGGKIY